MALSFSVNGRMRLKPLLAIGLIGLFLSACQQKPLSPTATVQVKRQLLTAPNIYSGLIKPLRIVRIGAPSDGTVTAVYVHLGQVVKADDLLLSIESPKFAKDYQQALLSYLKSKSDYTNQLKSFQGTEELWKNGLIARNDYNNQETQLANSYAMLLQQQAEVKKYLPPHTDIDTGLNLENKAQIDALFQHQQRDLKLYAPQTGVILSPSKPASGNGQDAPLIPTIGQLVKEGDNLLGIGDLNGYAIDINVSQMDIDNVKVGQPATVSGDAFPDTLTGVVTQVSIEAKTDASGGYGGTPSFPVQIQVEPVPAAAKAHIRLGMSAKVALAENIAPSLNIPISAVGYQGEQAVVVRVQQQKRQVVAITTGHTSIDRVEVVSGLQEGDTILATYPT